MLETKTDGQTIRRRFFLCAVIPAGIVSAMIVAVAISNARLPFPECGLKAVTGLPCPGCGATRGLAKLAEGDVSASFNSNPLVSIAAMGGLLVTPFVWLGMGSRTVRARGATAWAAGKSHLRWAVVGLLGANWIFLIFAG